MVFVLNKRVMLYASVIAIKMGKIEICHQTLKSVSMSQFSQIVNVSPQRFRILA